MFHNFCELGMWAQLSWAFVLGSLTRCSQGIACPIKINKFILKKRYCLTMLLLLLSQTMSLQLGLTLCDPMDCSPPPDSFIHGILQARIQECVAVPSSRASSQSRDWTCVSCLLHWQAGSLLLAPHRKPLPDHSHLKAWLGRNVLSRLYDCWQDSLSHGSLGW